MQSSNSTCRGCDIVIADKVICNKSELVDVANAVRSKLGVTNSYHVSELSAAIEDITTGIGGSPILDDGLENTTQYRQMNLTVAEFIANTDYTENANDYSITKVTPYYSATTEYSKEEPDRLKIKVPDGTVLTVAQGGKSRSEAVSDDGVIYNIEPLKAGSFSFGDKTYNQLQNFENDKLKEE